MARSRAALARHQLFRAGRAGLSRSRSHRDSVLSAGARGVDPAHGRAGHRGDRDCKPSGDHWRLLARAPGDPTRVPAAPCHPSYLEAYSGQIYIPRVNAALLIGVLLLVGLFRTSSALASAYGIAVATTMVADGLLGFIVIWKWWRWPLWGAVPLVIPFVVVDAAFLSANLLKVLEGAWVPLLFGISMVLLIITWRRGTELLASKTRRTEVSLDVLLRSFEKKLPPIVSGTAVFLTSTPELAPTALLHNLKHNKVLHEQNVILTVVTADTPRVEDNRRVTIMPISPRFSHVTLKFGYMETPNVPKALAIARKEGLHSTSCPHPFSFLVAPSSPLPTLACRGGRIACSSGLLAAPMMQATSSGFRPGVWSKWVRR